MGSPWRSVPDLLYQTYAPSDECNCRRSNCYPSDTAFVRGDRNTLPNRLQRSGGVRRPDLRSTRPSNVLCLKSAEGNTTTFTVASASLTRLPNGDDKTCIECQQYHLRRPEPITRQPQPSNARPQYMKVTSDWSTDLFGCMEDEHTCLLGALCTPCLACSLAGQLGESCCVATCVPGGLLAMRTKLRMQQNIQGSICDDCLALCCCCPFALCQMARELDNAEIGRL